MTRSCSICSAPIVQRDGERPNHLARRTTCGRSCRSRQAAATKQQQGGDRRTVIETMLADGASRYDIADHLGVRWATLRQWVAMHTPDLRPALNAAVKNAKPAAAHRPTAVHEVWMRSTPVAKDGRTRYYPDHEAGAWRLDCGLCGRSFTRISRRAVLKLAHLHHRTHLHDKKAAAA